MYKKRNQLLHAEKQMDEGNHVVNVNAETTNQSNEVTSLLHIIPASIQNARNQLNTYDFLDSRSTVSFIIVDQSVQNNLQAHGTEELLKIAGIHRTNDLKTEKAPSTTKRLLSKVHSIEAFKNTSI